MIDVLIQSLSREQHQCGEDGDIEASQVLDTILQKLYNLILNHSEYQKIPEIYLSIGSHQEQKNDPIAAIELYNEALALGSIESYMYLGNAYESRSRYEISTDIFAIAYQFS